MNVLLTGASGFLGRNIAKALTDTGNTVIYALRKQGVDFQKMLKPSDWLPHLHGVDAVVNCVGIIDERCGQTFDALHRAAPIALFRACVDVDVRRVIQVSALGADDTAFSAFHQSKLAADDVLRQSELDWFVLRPTLVYGSTAGTSSALFMRMAALPVIPLIGDGQQIVQPVHVSDVVATVCACLASSKPQQTIDVVGGQRFAFKEWLQFMRQAQGFRPAKFLSIPVPLVMATTYLGQCIDPMIAPDNLRMLQAGQFGDSYAMTELLGRKPLVPNSALLYSDTVQNDAHGSL